MDTGAWQCFLRSLALEIDSRTDAAGRDTLLRAVGQRMSRMTALPPVDSLQALELEINPMLRQIGWGRARLDLHEGERCVTITHRGLPAIGSAGEPGGCWLGAVLEGLYEGWMAQQPGADGTLKARRGEGSTPDELVIRYAKE